MSFLDGTSILVTGGTGSLGEAIVNFLLDKTKVRRIVVYSRDELKQYNLKVKLRDNPRLRWFIGDIRDLDRLKLALYNVDFVIHTAALKQVDTGEYNPMEFIKTNIIGSQNVIDASLFAGVKRVVALSTDKASSPINLYGATKLTSDKIFIAANNYSFARGTIFSVVRYGNVMGSRGSVIPFFQKLASKGEPIPITDLRMTRFWITIQNAVEFVIQSLEIMKGGELYVPRLPSMKITELATAISQNSKFIEIGIRPGEKLHEEMISEEDMRRTILQNNRYIVSPVVAEWGYQSLQGETMDIFKAYRSDTNQIWISSAEIKSFLDKYMNI